MRTGILNDLVMHELAVATHLIVHAVVLKHQGYKELSARYRKKAYQLGDHARALMERLHELGVVLNVTKLDEPPVSRSVKGQLEIYLAIEQETVPRLTSAIRSSNEEGDLATRVLLEKILIDAEHHVDWLESQLHLIAEIGLADYLAQQSAV